MKDIKLMKFVQKNNMSSAESQKYINTMLKS